MPENAAKEIQFCERWIKDGIGEDYRDWLPYIGKERRKASRIFIESPTGTGKSSFVLDILFRFAAENRRNVLYLTNRSALGQQVRNAAARKWKQKGRAEENEVSFRYPNTSRKAPSRRKSTINQQLRLLGLPYELKKEINCWILCKK